MKLALLLLLVASCVTAVAEAGGAANPASAVLAKYKDDACLQAASSASRFMGGTAAQFAREVCANKSCFDKIGAFAQELAAAGDNAYALWAHLLLFRRDMACLPGILPHAGNQPTCIEELENTVNSTSTMFYLASFEKWDDPGFWAGSHSIMGNGFLATAVDSVDRAHHITEARDLCKRESCLATYLTQWRIWLAKVALKYVEAIGNATDPASLPVGISKGWLNWRIDTFPNEINERCADRYPERPKFNDKIEDLALVAGGTLEVKPVASHAGAQLGVVSLWLAAAGAIVGLLAAF